MIIKSDISGIDALLDRVRKAQAELPRVTKNAAQRAGDTVKDQISSASPHGRGGPPPPTDAPGPLSGSFSAKAEQQGVGAHMELKTSQGVKLGYVTQGTGIYAGKGLIKPLRAKALFWPGASHPVRSVKGMKGKDFVTPIMHKRDDVVEVEMQKAIKEIKDIMNANS